jgi:hypothetical protein
MKTSVFIALAVLAAVAFALTIGLIASGGVRTAHAQPECVELEEGLWCVSLDPETATNTVGDEHTVTATVTFDGEPLNDILVDVTVFDGPNVGDFDVGLTNASGQFSFTYTGDGGPGTDFIGACDIDELGECVEPVTFDEATKTWVEPTPTPTDTSTPAATPTPTPTLAGLPIALPPATATPTPTPTTTALAATPTPTATPTSAPTTVLEAAQLPRTGGTPSDGGGLPWLAIAAGALALISGGFVLAYRTRRTR